MRSWSSTRPLRFGRFAGSGRRPARSSPVPAYDDIGRPGIHPALMTPIVTDSRGRSHDWRPSEPTWELHSPPSAPERRNLTAPVSQRPMADRCTVLGKGQFMSATFDAPAEMTRQSDPAVPAELVMTRNGPAVSAGVADASVPPSIPFDGTHLTLPASTATPATRIGRRVASTWWDD